MKPNDKTYNPSTDTILKNIINSIVATANPDKIILFGSRAMGKESKDSDYDICVLKKKLKNQNELAKKIYCNLFGVGAGVDVILQSVKRFEELKDKWFFVYNDIAKHGKVIYEK